MKDKYIQLSHGGGGEEMNQLIKGMFFSAFDNEVLRQEEDAAVLSLSNQTAFTTDSFTVSPLIFNGGDIGKLAVAGTVNDLAMMGAQPLYLSCSFILEEGLAIETLGTIVESMAKELQVSGALVVCGDTKVVPRGCADGIFINTAGLGQLRRPGISAHQIREGDAIIVSRDIGCHGATVLMNREGLELSSDLQSDCATLWPVVEALIAAGIDIHAMRDATRGGLSAVVNEWARTAGIGITLDEKAIPVRDEVRGLCELYGMEPFDLANEGTFVLALPAEQAEVALAVMRHFSCCPEAAVIGCVDQRQIGRVLLTTPWGSLRYLDAPQGELLPRIC
ncbi:hydrogenase assembly protein HupF [Photobacterium aquae]|uniref:Hydrogenase assembly protein HupF n=1 Tax=Photobacterium aquae TaxID=1195763 RepID=A0A0J1JM07_9GAMM|nr:hydrogenase expression/formation protein HypE [Photobacterium aquae]KLV03187.1 hydrogenase assembly protein HupF [Photobacterium aquae]